MSLRSFLLAFAVLSLGLNAQAKTGAKTQIAKKSKSSSKRSDETPAAQIRGQAKSKASQGSYVRVSPNAQVRWPASMGPEPVYLVNLDAYVVEPSKKQPYSVLIKRDKPIGMANQFSASRLWRSSVIGAADLFKKTSDKGCKRLSSRVYSCERLAVSNMDEWVAERMTWSGDQDLVYTRVSGPKAGHSPEGTLAKLDVWVPTRLRGKQ